MSEIKLLPLPEPMDQYSRSAWGQKPDLYTDEQLRTYARANVAHATAAKDAEIEALRDLCGAAYQLAGVHDAPEVWLDALSAAASGYPFSTDGLLPYMPDAVCEAESRAERLAEALRDALEYLNHHLPDEALAPHRAALRDHDQEGKDG